MLLLGGQVDGFDKDLKSILKKLDCFCLNPRCPTPTKGVFKFSGEMR